MSISPFYHRFLWSLFASCWLAHSISAARAQSDVAELPADRQVTYIRDIAPMLTKNCLACHNDQNEEGGVNLETVQKMQASDTDDLLVPGKPDQSRLFLLAAHRNDPVMPPEDNDVSASPLTPIELDLLRRWIATGAKADPMDAPAPAVPSQPLPRALKTNFCAAMTPDARLTAVGFGNRVRIFAGTNATTSAELSTTVDGQSLPAHQDFVRDLAVDAAGRRVISSGHRNVKIWEIAPPQRTQIPTIHPNVLVAVAMNRPGTHVAQLAPQGELSVATIGKSRWDWMKGFDFPSGWSKDSASVQMAINDLGEAVAVGSGKEIRIVRIDGRQAETLQLAENLTQIVWAPDGQLVIGGSSGQIWVARNANDEWTFQEHNVLDAPLTYLGISAANRDQVVAIDQSGHIANLTLLDGKVERQGAIPAPVHSAALSPQGDGLWAVNATGNLGVYRFGEKKWVEFAKSDPVALQHYNRQRWKTLVGERLLAAKQKRLTQAEADVKAEQESLETLAKDLVNQTKTLDESRTAVDAAKLAVDTATKQAAEAKLAQQRENAKRTELSGSIKKLDDSTKQLEEQIAALTAERAALEQSLAEIPDAKELAAATKSANDSVSKAQKALESKQADLTAATDVVTASEEKLKRGRRRLSELAVDVNKKTQAVEASQIRQEELVKSEAASKRVADQSNASDRGLMALAGQQRLLTYSEASAAWSRWSTEGEWLGEIADLPAPQFVGVSAGSTLLLQGPDGNLSAFRFAPNHWQLARVIGSATGQSPFADRVLCIDVDQSGRFLATGGGLPSRSGELLIWDLVTGQLLQRIDRPHADTVISLRFSPDGKTLASGSTDRMLKLWNTEDWSLIKTLEGHTHHVTAIDWNVNLRQLASGSADATVKVWDIETSKAERTISGLKSEVTNLVYVGRDDQIAIACGDGYFRLYRTDNGQRKINVKLPGGYLYALDSEREGSRFVVGGASGHAVIVDASGKQVTALKDTE
ncbi:MAG TPA: hypothetical protein DDW52_10755 [Planctomycetaceae bacterium]|nr:hypothetical protein [Planctomycetaceae bacterium]